MKTGSTTIRRKTVRPRLLPSKKLCWKTTVAPARPIARCRRCVLLERPGVHPRRLVSAGLPAARRLDFYAHHFELVELNSSFYALKMPAHRWIGRSGQVVADARDC